MTIATDDRCLILAARQVVAAALSRAMLDPRFGAGVPSPDDEELRMIAELWRAWGDDLCDCPPASLGLGELLPQAVDPQPLCDWLALPNQRRQQAHLAVFGLTVCKQCPPYETEYCHWNDPTYRSHQLADIAGFYRAFGVEPSRHRPDRHDHIALELEFISLLLCKQRLAIESNQPDHEATCETAMTAFVRDHVTWWMPTFAKCMQNHIEQLLPQCPSGDLRTDLTTLHSLGDLLRAFVAAVRLSLHVEPCRRIISPQVTPTQPADSEDESACGACDAAGDCNAAQSASR